MHISAVTIDICGEEEIFTKDTLKEMNYEDLKMLCSFCSNTKTLEKIAKLSECERLFNYINNLELSIS